VCDPAARRRADSSRQCLSPVLAGALHQIVNGHGGQAMQAAASGSLLGNALQAAKLALQIT